MLDVQDGHDDPSSLAVQEIDAMDGPASQAVQRRGYLLCL
jgi:hypothetical protein